jgi:hypothetical protein
MEQLDGIGTNKTFDTPLGTNHAFQGWADLFLVTPKNGIQDVFATVSSTLDRGEVVLTGVYHDLLTIPGRSGTAMNGIFRRPKFGKHYSLLAKYAYYSAGDYNQADTFINTDTQKSGCKGT